MNLRTTINSRLFPNRSIRGQRPDSRRQRLLRLGLVAGVPLLIVAIALLLPPRMTTLVLVGLLGIGMVAVFLRWPSAGVIALIPASLFVPIAMVPARRAASTRPCCCCCYLWFCGCLT